MRVAINGFGRIGRSVFRILNAREDIDVVAINDLFDHDALAYLLKYDTIMKKFGQDVHLENDNLITPNENVKMIRYKDPNELPWKELGIDVVIEATGIFRTRELLQPHLNAGAKRVVLTVPAKDDIDFTIVLGVNDAGLNVDTPVGVIVISEVAIVPLRFCWSIKIRIVSSAAVISLKSSNTKI